MVASSESAPTAVLLLAVVLAPKALNPSAVLAEPVVLASSESAPTDVL